MIKKIFLFLVLVSTVYPQTGVNVSSINDYENEDLTTWLIPSFLDAYGESIVRHFTFNRSVFSPDGRYLALVIDAIHSADQVWRIDLETKKVIPVTELLSTEDPSLTIEDISWKSDTLLRIRMNRSEKHNNKRLLLWASLTNTTQETYPPSLDNEIVGPYKHDSNLFDIDFQAQGKATLTNLSTGKKNVTVNKELNYKYVNQIDWTFDEKNFVFIYNFGHGALSLYLAVTSPNFKIFKIDDGYWGLEEYAISPISSQVAYAANRDNSINVYDIKSHKVINKLMIGRPIGDISWSIKNQLSFVTQAWKGDSIFVGKNIRVNQYLHLLQLKDK
jgi:hypothetical protein